MVDERLIKEWFDKADEDFNFASSVIYYIDTRYPVHWPAHYTKEDSLKAKKSTEKIASTIRAFLNLTAETQRSKSVQPEG